MFKNLFLTVLAVMLFQGLSFAKISEKELKRYNSTFLNIILDGNKSNKSQIRRLLNGVVKNEDGGIRIIDKFGLFMYDCQKNSIVLKKAKFFHSDSVYHFFLILEDINDKQLYTLYLEYGYDYQKRSYHLMDIYFSLVFNEKMKEIEKFFKYR
ncbi:hypothetical protein ACFL20_09995 [Spirochaetota bacterium]